ncbi:MAG: response regulator [Elusimicrobia bacterium]|nr:response regulator [Elusimicrobiota bacterium]
MPRRTLIIEDDPSVSRLLMRLLGVTGRSVLAVAGTADLPAALETGPFDEAFVDVDLPEGADGIQVSLGLLRQRPSLHLVVMSGDAAHLERASAAGLKRRLPKPFTPSELQAVLSPG